MSIKIILSTLDCFVGVKHFRDTLQENLDRLGISQREFAKEAGVSYSTVNRFINCKDVMMTSVGDMIVAFNEYEREIVEADNALTPS